MNKKAKSIDYKGITSSTNVQQVFNKRKNMVSTTFDFMCHLDEQHRIKHVAC